MRAAFLPRGICARRWLPVPVSPGHVVEHVVGVGPAQDLQEVLPALAGGALEVGEQVVADVGAGAVLAPVAGAGVVHPDVLGPGQSGRRLSLNSRARGAQSGCSAVKFRSVLLAGGRPMAPLHHLAQRVPAA